MLDFVFADGFGFERYVDYLLDVPMYFVYRDGRYIDASGKSFRDVHAWQARRAARRVADHERLVRPHDHGLPGSAAEESSWRCAVPMAGRGTACARLPAFWVGLLYDDAALDAAWDLVKDFSDEERNALRDGVPKHGAEAPLPQRHAARHRHRSLEDRRRPAPARTAQCLRCRRSGFLEPLMDIADANETPAERKLALFHGEWNGSVDPVFREFAY
jgi:glutamate--cysteine ligase